MPVTRSNGHFSTLAVMPDSLKKYDCKYNSN